MIFDIDTCHAFLVPLGIIVACPLLKSDLSSLDFVVNRFFMKLFRTSNDIIKQCQYYFGFPVLSVLWAKRV